MAIYGGDYNCVNIPDRDTRNMPQYSNQGATKLNLFCQYQAIVDVWVHISDQQREGAGGGFTRFAPNSQAASRIDRIYASSPHLNQISNISTIPQPDLTDHEGVQIQIKPNSGLTKPRNWRLNVGTLHDPKFVDRLELLFRVMVQQARPDTPALQLWMDFKKQVKRAAVSWGTARAADRRRLVRSTQQQLLQPELPQEERRRLKALLTRCNASAQVDLSISSSTKYQAGGDRPTASFFAKLGKSTAYRPIKAMTMPSGEVTTDLDEIGAEMTRFWGGVFGEGVQEPVGEATRCARATSLNRINTKLSPSQSAALAAPITIEEMGGVLERAKKGKTPGVDGLPIEFYQKCWNFIGPILTLIAADLLAGHELPAEMVQAKIAMIPKTEAQAPLSSKFRPISLLNSDYKLLAAVIASRVATTLPNLVDEHQTGFVPGRLILENITFNRDLIDFCEDTNSTLFMAFLDFEKAFDRVSWSYRDQVMERMGFPASLVDAVRGLYTHANSQISLNDRLTRPIRQTRGVRQGCPLSPVLFAIFAEPLGLLIRSLEQDVGGRPKCGVDLPRADGESKRIVGSQFADDTTLYAQSKAALRFSMSQIKEEFCTASGAKLNADKTRTLEVGPVPDQPIQPQQPPAPAWQQLELILLQEHESIKSLGANYGPNTDPSARFDIILEAIQARMGRWQARYPSLHARVLIANTLLSSCLWFFAYFISPSPAQLKRFDDVVWGMLWSKQRGGVGTRGQINRFRIAQQRSRGGLGVIIPSVMIRALRTNMVNRALMDTGRWWTPFFHHWCRSVAGGFFRGADILLQPPQQIKQAVRAIPSSFWPTAITDWSVLRYSPPPMSKAPHREAVGATPVLALSLPAEVRRNPTPVVRLMVRSNLIYLSDVFDMARLEWCDALSLGALLTPHVNATTATPAETITWMRRWFRRLEKKFKDEVDALRTNRDEATPPDGPHVGEVWADPSTQPMLVGVVHQVDSTFTGPLLRDGPDRDECVCGEEGGSQGDCVLLEPTQHVGGAGVRATNVDEGEVAMVTCCSCVLTPVHTTDKRLYGAMSLTNLAPNLLTAQLKGGGDEAHPLTLGASVRLIRNAFMQQMAPAAAKLPPVAEHKWAAELGLSNFGITTYQAAKQMQNVEEMRAAVNAHPNPPPPQLNQLLNATQSTWRSRWVSISRVQLSGPLRSFLYKLMHRTLPLLHNTWRANYYGRTTNCMMCTDQQPETYSHLFSDCAFASTLWNKAQEVTQILLPLLQPHMDPRPARLIGDITQSDVQQLRESWPNAEMEQHQQPTERRLTAWTRDAWNEVRATILHSIWISRCELLAGTVDADEAKARAAVKSDLLLRSLAYTKLPSLLPGIIAHTQSQVKQTFYKLTWGKLTHLLLLPRHVVPLTPENQ